MVRVQVHRIVNKSDFDLRLRYPNPAGGGEAELVVPAGCEKAFHENEPEVPWSVRWLSSFWVEQMSGAKVAADKVRLSIGRFPEASEMNQDMDFLQVYDDAGNPIEPDTWSTAGKSHEWGLWGETRRMVLLFEDGPLSKAVRLLGEFDAEPEGLVYLTLYEPMLPKNLAGKWNGLVGEDARRGVFDVTVQVYEKEYYFDNRAVGESGILAMSADDGILVPDARQVRKIALGATKHEPHVVARYVADIMQPAWVRSIYCDATNNSKHFAAEFIRFLGVEKPDYLPDGMTSTPGEWHLRTFLKAPTLNPFTDGVLPFYVPSARLLRDRWDEHGMEHSMFVTNAGATNVIGQYCYYVRFVTVENCDARPELNGRFMRRSNTLYVHEERMGIICFDPQSDQWALSALCGRFSSPEEAAHQQSPHEYVWHIDGSAFFSKNFSPMVWTRPDKRKDLHDCIIVTAYHGFVHRDGSKQLVGDSRGWSLGGRKKGDVIYFVKGGWSALPPEDSWESGPLGLWPPPIVKIDRRPERKH